MIFPKVDTLVIPKNIEKHISENGMWENSEYSPIEIIIDESFYNNERTVCYQLQFEPLDIIDEWEENGFELEILESERDFDGDDFESYIRDYISKRDIALLNNLHGGSKSSTCVLWVDNETDFRKLLNYCFKALAEPSI